MRIGKGKSDLENVLILNGSAFVGRERNRETDALALRFLFIFLDFQIPTVWVGAINADNAFSGGSMKRYGEMGEICEFCEGDGSSSSCGMICYSVGVVKCIYHNPVEWKSKLEESN